MDKEWTGEEAEAGVPSAPGATGGQGYAQCFANHLASDEYWSII